MLAEVIHQIIPHLRVMLMQVLAVPRKVRNREWSATLEHDRDGTLADAHLRRRCSARSLELFVGDTVGNHTAFVAGATRLELVTAASVLAVDETHKFGGDVAVVVGWAVGVGSDVPAGREDEEVGERSGGVAGLGGEDAEDGGVDVVDGDGANVDELR